MYHGEYGWYGEFASITITSVSSSLKATVSVHSNVDIWITSFVLQPGESRQMLTTNDGVSVPFGGTKLGNYGTKISSTEDITVVAQYLPTANKVGVFLVYPPTSNGLDYFAITEEGNYRSRCVVVATRSNTKLRILLNFASKGKIVFENQRYWQGEMMSLTMESTQTLHISTGHNGHDLIGTRIRSNKPIVVFCGGETESRNGVFIEQMLPSETWGMHYILPPLNANYIKVAIVSRVNSNYITINSSVCPSSDLYFDLNYTGSYLTQVLNSTSLCEYNVYGWKEIAIVLFIPFGSTSDDDQAALAIPCTMQFVTNTKFVIPNSTLDTQYLLEYVVRQSTVNNPTVYLDRSVISDGSDTILNVGLHNVSSTSEIFPYIYEKITDNGSKTNYVFSLGMSRADIIEVCIL